MKIFVTADTHFNHENIIKYCNRPFVDAGQMNKEIINKWNSLVADDDMVYHLGDVGFGSMGELTGIIQSLKGKKILVKGNHDIKRGSNSWKEVGFTEVHKKKFQIDNIILTHEAVEVPEGCINIFGHIHDKPVNPEFDDNRHFCVSLERTDYYPIELTKVLEELQELVIER